MAAKNLNPTEQKLSRQTKADLAALREQRTLAQKHAFTQKVMAEIRLPENAAALDAKPRGRSPLKKYLLVAAGLVTGLLGVMAMMTDMFSSWHTIDEDRLRREAAPIALPRDLRIMSQLQWFEELEGENLVFLAYEYSGERCLWLYPEKSIRFVHDPEERARFEKVEKWIRTVSKGTVEIPASAIQSTFKGDEPLVFLKVGYHFEIWTEAGLKRYLEKSANNS